MSSVEVLKQKLFEQLETLLRERGFEFIKSRQSYERKTAFGKQIIHLTIVHHKSDFDVAIRIAIRFSQLEDLLNEYRPYLSKREKAQTASIGIGLGDPEEGRQRRWTIVSEADVLPVVIAMMQTIEEEGLIHLDKFSTLKQLLLVFAGDDDYARSYAPGDELRARKAIATAFLLRDRYLFNQLAERKTNHLQRQQSRDLPDFQALMESLTGCW